MNDLEIGLRLLVGARAASRRKDLVVAEDHICIKRVSRPFAGLEWIRLSRIQTETAQPIIHNYAGVAADQARSERRKDALDQRDRVTITIGGAEIRGIAALVGNTGRRSINRIVGQFAPRCRMFFRDQHGDFRIAKRGVLEVTNTVFEREFFCSHLVMNPIGTAERALVHGPRLRDIEHLEDHKPLRHRRLLVYLHVTITRAQRLEPLGDDLAQILRG